MEDAVRVFAGVQFLIIGLSHASSTPNSFSARVLTLRYRQNVITGVVMVIVGVV